MTLQRPNYIGPDVLLGDHGDRLAVTTDPVRGNLPSWGILYVRTMPIEGSVLTLTYLELLVNVATPLRVGDEVAFPDRIGELWMRDMSGAPGRRRWQVNGVEPSELYGLQRATLGHYDDPQR